MIQVTFTLVLRRRRTKASLRNASGRSLGSWEESKRGDTNEGLGDGGAFERDWAWGWRYVRRERRLQSLWKCLKVDERRVIGVDGKGIALFVDMSLRVSGCYCHC